MVTNQNTRAVLHGTLTGTIWLPAVECTKQVKVDLTRERERLVPARGGSLRHLIGNVCNDGDFQSAKLTDDSAIEVTTWQQRGNCSIRRTKVFPITQFKDIQDYVEVT